MKIIKYLFLIALLLTIGLSVFVSTQSAQFKIVKSKLIKTPRSEIYNYVHDFNNWDTFITTNNGFKNDSSNNQIEANLGSITIENKNYKTLFKTISTIKNQSINQIKIADGASSTYNWFFKDTVGGTKVTLKNEGFVDFKTKIYSFFKGGIAAIVGNDAEFTLENLNKTLHLELDRFDIKLNGIVTQDSTYFVKRELTCYENDIEKNVKIILPQLQKFCADKNVATVHKSFIGIEKKNPTSTIVKLSVFISVQDTVLTSPRGVYSFGLLNKFSCFKATLKGNYSHIDKLKAAVLAESAKSKININVNGSYFEIYKIADFETKSKTNCITEMLIPLAPEKPKYIRVKRPVGDTTREPGDSAPTDVNIIPEKEIVPKPN